MLEELVDLRRQLAAVDPHLRRREAVDRVAKRVISMRSSVDFVDVVGVVYEELLRLGVTAHVFALYVWDYEENIGARYVARENPRQHNLSWKSPDLVEYSSEIVVGFESIPILSHHGHASSATVWTDRWTADYWRETQLSLFVKHFGIIGYWPALDVGPVDRYCIRFDHGYFFFVGAPDMPSKEQETLGDFAEVIALGTSRLLDFQAVESAHRLHIDRLEAELETARASQMRLMPSGAPEVHGLDLAGRCSPATHVGGDFFQYFDRIDKRLSISLADVTGHAMEAAVPVMMFAGILKTEMQYDHTIENLFGNLNKTLHESLDRRTFICFTMAEFDLTSRTLRLSNCGCPYPFHYKADTQEVVELQMAAYPLGIRADSTYEAIEVQLESGDRVVFCSDGIVEAANTQREMFTFEQTAEVIRQGCQQGLSAEALLEHLFGRVKAFTGEAK